MFVIASALTGTACAKAMFVEDPVPSVVVAKPGAANPSLVSIPANSRSGGWISVGGTGSANPAAPASSAWVIRSGSIFQDDISAWAKQAGWQVSWEMPDEKQFVFDSGVAFPGDFGSAVNALADLMNSSGMPVSIEMYDGNKVIRVMPKGASRRAIQ